MPDTTFTRQELIGRGREPPAVNQVELHPVHRQDALLAACAELGTHLTAYSPLGSPDSASMIKHDGASVMEHPAVGAIAAATGPWPGSAPSLPGACLPLVRRHASRTPALVAPRATMSNSGSTSAATPVAGQRAHDAVELR